ncbi:MAG TPA: esterase-like activity of phytase family protein, partial [Allosphingosinicella sp.]
PVHFQPLEAGPGPRSRKVNRDTEAMLIRGGEMWVAFEHHNMIWRYRRAGPAALSSARPPAMRSWPGNAGAEGLVRLGDGRFLVFGEGRDDDRPLGPAVLFAGDPSVPGTPATSISYRRAPGYRASDAALLPDGRILLLTRRFSAWQGWSARLAVADVTHLGAESVIEAREIAALQAPLTVDNMEALSVTREGARTIVWIASDDNFGALQRTLLLKFELRG